MSKLLACMEKQLSVHSPYKPPRAQPAYTHLKPSVYTHCNTHNFARRSSTHPFCVPPMPCSVSRLGRFGRSCGASSLPSTRYAQPLSTGQPPPLQPPPPPPPPMLLLPPPPRHRRRQGLPLAVVPGQWSLLRDADLCCFAVEPVIALYPATSHTCEPSPWAAVLAEGW